jgi:outer membrane protein
MTSIVRRFAPLAAAAALAVAGLSVTSGALAQGPAAAPAASPRVAVIDLRRAVIETEEGLRVQATLKKLFDARQVELSQKERSLQGELEELEKEAKAGKAPPAAISQKREALQRQYAGLQQTLVEYQREMQRKEGELTQPMVQRVLGIIKRVATTEGFDAVLEKSAVPYIRADLDLTDRVIQMFNAGGGDAGAKAPPAAPKAPAAKPPAAPPAQVAPKKK